MKKAAAILFVAVGALATALPIHHHRQLLLASIGADEPASYPRENLELELLFDSDESDTSGNSRTVTLSGGASVTGGYIDCTSASAKAEVTDTSSELVGSEMTVAFWTYVTATPGAFHNWSSKYGPSGNALAFGYMSSKITVQLYDTTWRNYNSTVGAPALNTWTHLAFTRRSSGQLEIYRNGVSVGYWSSAANPLTPSTAFALAGRDQDSNYGVRCRLDDVLVYSSGMSDSEIENLYNHREDLH